MVFLILVYIQIIFALERCNSLIPYIKDAHFYYFGVDFPYAYSVAQAEKESRCKHHALSTDGIGSEGFAQITYPWWKSELDKEGILEIKSLKGHARAQAYINYRAYQQSYCKKLFETYQIYNGGNLVSKELQRAGSCKWEDGLKVCRRKDICVWRTEKECKQWRNACDVNYEYSLTIYKLAPKYGFTDSEKYPFW